MTTTVTETETFNDGQEKEESHTCKTKILASFNSLFGFLDV